ncbi:MAG: hypothetical protein IJA16_03755, partial [Clostridia bacterium]|nr:hypothetical protein [Clostridia bacterium]
MTGGKGKRAVIINNIKSGMIEQAIFILKSPAGESLAGAGSGIVAEAQEIINSYIDTIEGRRIGDRKKRFSKNALLIAILGAGFAATIAVGLLL